MKIAISLILLEIVVSIACFGQASGAQPSSTLERMPELLETRFALSAAPLICEATRQFISWIRLKVIC